MTTALNKLPGKAFELTLNISWPEIKPVYEKVLDLFLSEVEIGGFRKGKAPKDLALKKIDQGKVLNEVINEALPKFYSDAVKEHNLTPITTPRAQVVQAELDKDWIFLATSCEKPEIDLGNFQDAIRSINAKGKIWKPGDEKTAEKAEDKSQRVSEIISKLLETAKLELPSALVEQEANRLLAQLVDDVRQAGLTMDQYLASKNLNPEQLQSQYKSQAETTLKLEFILEEIAKTQNITISQEEIDSVINHETDLKVKENLKNQAYLLASILRREKTLTYLSNL